MMDYTTEKCKMCNATGQPTVSGLRPGHTGPTDELRIDRDQIPAFARVLHDLDRLCVVVRDVQSAHESLTDRVRTALIALKTR